MRTYGYARVSASDQNLQRQLDALAEYGITERDIITDKLTGKDFIRPGWTALKNQMLRSGDTLVVLSLDRLGRDYAMIKDEYRDLHEMGVSIVILDMPLLSTVDKTDLEKTLIANIIFELLAYVAEKERRNIKSRQSQGIEAAKKKGVKFGRPTASAPPDFEAECAKWQAGEQTAVETMTRLGLKRTTFYKLVRLFGSAEV